MKKENKCFDLNNPKQKKHYENWKRFIKNLTDKPNESKSKNKENVKKTFEDYFPVSTITKSINRLDYEPILRA